MESFDVTKDGAVVHLTSEEIRFLHQSLNEIISGVGFTDDELSARLGATREELKTLRQELSRVLVETRS